MNRKGFTLVELLIVIAIIGILASAVLVSLGGARASARDARRISDLRQVQSVLELYYTKTGVYPPDGITWQALQDEYIIKENLGVSKIPNDPSPPKSYSYGTNDNQSYTLRAELEGNNPVLDSDVDGITPAGDCNDVTPPYQYCVEL